MRFLVKLLRITLSGLFGAFLLGVLLTAGVYISLAPNLPSIEVLKDMRLQVPLRVYSLDGALLAEFGEKRRSPVKFQDIPELMIRAVLAAEDDRFFEHPGVDYQGILRAAYHLIKTGEKGQGGSTITMQVARNFFLSREKTFLRKISEIFLALKIERELTKEEVLELYFNKIYLGNRAYGVQAAAQVYYGKKIKDLNLPQMAMIAGLPKAPSRYNPIANPRRALIRRDYVLRRMNELNFIDNVTLERARATGVSARMHALTVALEAPYLAEMVRADMVRRFGNEAYTSGYQVITTVDSTLQRAANSALRKALRAYDERHGYRGPERHFDPGDGGDDDAGRRLLAELPVVGGLLPALVRSVAERSAGILLTDGRSITLDWPALSWARRYIDDRRLGPAPQAATDILETGDVVRVLPLGNGIWRLSQRPEVEGALVALAPDDGAIRSLVGGFDFYQSKFNRATQAQRQPGSSFKPFIYSAALEKGFTPASLINDAPVVFEDSGLESTWRPENYSGRFFGPTRLRVALTHSRNLVSIRLLREIGIRYAVDHIARFGFDAQQLPRNLSLALGSASITPLELASANAILANGGYRVEPYFITHIIGPGEEMVYEAKPATVCETCEEAPPASPRDGGQTGISAENGTTPAAVTAPLPESIPENIAPRVISAQNHYLITSMMRDVILHGTGRKALSLGRRDLAGKTGTTNDQRDAWFAGFNRSIVAVTWVGFDSGRPLGNRETGARAALPMWIAFMEQALRGVPETLVRQPPGLVSVRIDPETGFLADADQRNAIFEIFRTDNVPRRIVGSGPLGGSDSRDSPGVPEQIF